jgi:hypothetical protein
MQRADEIRRRLDLLWPISDHTWDTSGTTVLNEWGVPILTVTDSNASALLELITHAVGDLRWAVGEIARLEAATQLLAQHCNKEHADVRALLAQMSGVDVDPDTCPVCSRNEVTSVVEEVRQ